MEKYTRWRDAGTGIAPFLPVAVPESLAAMLPLRILLFLVRFPVLSVLLLIHIILVDFILGNTLSYLYDQAYLTVRRQSARTILFCAGFHSIPISWDERKWPNMRGGDVIITNRSSPLDHLLLLALVPGVLFTRSAGDGVYGLRSLGAGMVDAFRLETRVEQGYSLDQLRALYQVVPIPSFQHQSHDSISNKNKKSSISISNSNSNNRKADDKENKENKENKKTKKKERERQRAIVVFPECTTSNNRGLLKFTDAYVLQSGPAFVISIKYANPAYLATPLPGFTASLAFTWALCSRLHHGVRIRGSSHVVTGSASEEALAKLGRLAQTALGLADKSAFLQAFIT